MATEVAGPSSGAFQVPLSFSTDTVASLNPDTFPADWFNAVNEDNRTLLQQAIHRSEKVVVEMCLSKLCPRGILIKQYDPSTDEENNAVCQIIKTTERSAALLDILLGYPSFLLKESCVTLVGPNARGSSPLHIAAMKEVNKIFEVLYQHYPEALGETVVYTSGRCLSDFERRSPLFSAVEQGAEKISRILLPLCSQRWTTRKGHNILHVAINSRQPSQRVLDTIMGWQSMPSLMAQEELSSAFRLTPLQEAYRLLSAMDRSDELSGQPGTGSSAPDRITPVILLLKYIYRHSNSNAAQIRQKFRKEGTCYTLADRCKALAFGNGPTPLHDRAG